MSKKKRHEIRSEMRKILSNLDERWQRAASTALCSNLTELLQQLHEQRQKPFTHILAWTAFFTGEVDLSPFISEHVSSVQFYLPRSLPDRSMQFINIQSDWKDETEQGAFGIPEPRESQERMYQTDGGANTLVLAPGLAFDRRGNRLGRGKGHYDRFLGRSEMQEATVVGIAWELQVINAVPIESHDIPMDWICHEEGHLRTALEYSEEF